MKTKIALILTLGLAGLLAQAAPAGGLTVAVYDFKGVGPAGRLGAEVTALLTADLATETNLVMVERAELTKALNEEAFGASGLVSSDAAAKIGQITGAKVLVAGQVIQTGGGHLIVVANIIGTETGRLFADQVEGPAENLPELTADLGKKIAGIISAQAVNLEQAAEEPEADRLARIIQNLPGTNRPSVGLNIGQYGGGEREEHDIAVEGELGAILLKAGFTVVDEHSDRKPDVEINGAGHFLGGKRQGGVFSASFGLDIKVQNRRTGSILAFEHQENTATAGSNVAAMTAAQVNVVDALAERILPVLTK